MPKGTKEQLVGKEMVIKTTFTQSVIREMVSNGDCAGNVEHMRLTDFSSAGTSWGELKSANIRGVIFNMRYDLETSKSGVIMRLGGLGAEKAIHLNPSTYQAIPVAPSEYDKFDNNFKEMAKGAKETLIEAAIYYGMKNKYTVLVSSPEFTKEIRSYAKKRGYNIEAVDKWNTIKITETQNTKLLRVVG